MVIPLLGVKTRCADKSAAEHYNIHTIHAVFGGVMHYTLLPEILKNITGYHTLFGLNGDSTKF